MTTRLTLPALSRPFDVVFDSQALFRTVLHSMARPGTIGHVAADPGCPQSGCQVIAAIMRTLLDHEVTLAVIPGCAGEENDADALAAYAIEMTGARLCSVAEAGYVVLLGAPGDELLPSLRRGQPAYPDEGATLVASLPSFAPVAESVSIALAGPGVMPGTRLTLPGWSERDVAELEAVNDEPPLGIDLILATPAGEVACLPRSTHFTIDEAG